MRTATSPAQMVFIVTSDPDLRRALHLLTTSDGLHPVWFSSAAEYRDYCKPDTAACLILDVNLPDMSGLELQQQIAATDPPIVFVAGQSDVRTSVRAIKAGAVDFLTSPFRSSDLLHAVETAIAKDRETRSERAHAAQLQRRLARLTPREREVLTLVSTGLLNRQSACELGISGVTLQIHRSNMMQKMEARSVPELVRMATMLDLPLASCNRTPGRRLRSGEASDYRSASGATQRMDREIRW